VAFVTGASSGLGRHFAGVLARAGARVAIAARRADKLEAVREEIAAAGAEAIAVPLDVGSIGSVEAAVATTVERLGGIDILVNNAGVTVNRPVLEMTEADWDHVVDTDLKGAFLVAQAAARVMRDGRRGGVIVNVASILGLRVAGHVAAYVAAKAGLVRLSQAMALELARHHPRQRPVPRLYRDRPQSGVLGQRSRTGDDPTYPAAPPRAA